MHGLPNRARRRRRLWFGSATTIACAQVLECRTLLAVTADIVDVLPAERSGPVPSIQIVFSEPVTGFDIGDLTLSRDGGADLLSASAASLSTSDGGASWSLSGLVTLTDEVGAYELTLERDGSDIAGPSGALENNASQPWANRAVVGTVFNDIIRIRTSPLDAGVVDVFLNNTGTKPSYSFIAANLARLDLLGLGGDDVLIIDLINGTPPISGEIVTDGGGHGTLGDLLRVDGTGGDDTLTVQASLHLHVGSALIRRAGVEFTAFNHGAGNDTLNLAAGTWTFPSQGPLSTSGLSVNAWGDVTLLFPASRQLASLQLHDRSTAIMDPDGGKLLRLGSLNVAPDAWLDLENNSLSIVADQFTKDSVLADVTAHIRRARYDGSGAWLAPGITSSAARSDSLHLTTLAPFINDTPGGAPLFASIGGIPLASSDVLVRYGPYGDANLDGRLGAADYLIVDRGEARGLAGWRNGDFDLLGGIDGADYFLLDTAFLNQLAAASQVAAKAPQTPAFTAPVALHFWPLVVAQIEPAIDQDDDLLLSSAGVL